MIAGSSDNRVVALVDLLVAALRTCLDRARALAGPRRCEVLELRLADVHAGGSAAR